MALMASSGVLLDFEVDSADENLIVLKCYGDHDMTPNPNSNFTFFDPITESIVARLSPQPDGNLRFDVTPTTEAVVTCSVGGESSQAEPIAGEFIAGYNSSICLKAIDRIVIRESRPFPFVTMGIGIRVWHSAFIQQKIMNLRLHHVKLGCRRTIKPLPLGKGVAIQDYLAL